MRSRAQYAAQERALAAYIPLECGHYQDRETYMHYRMVRTAKYRYRTYCEQCNDIVGIKRPDKPKDTPGEPLF